MNKILVLRIFAAAFMIAMVFSTPTKAWAFSDCTHRQLLNLVATDSGTNVSILLNISYVPSMNTTFSDLRFVGNETYNITHYVDKYVASSYADVWLGFNNTNWINNTDIYAYHGCSGDLSNYTAKFFHGLDEFNRADSQTVGNGWTENGKVANVNITNNKLHLDDDDAQGAWVSDKYGFDDPTRIDINWDYTFGTTDGAGINCYDAGTLTWIVRFDTPASTGYKYYDGSYHTVATYTNSQNYNWSLRNINYSADTYDLYLNETLVKTGAPFIGNTGCNNISTSSSGAGTSLADIDYIRMQKQLYGISYSAGSPEGLVYNSTSESYNTTDVEGATESFVFTVIESLVAPTANFSFNGTKYSVTPTISGSNYTFTKTITLPNVSADTSVGFYWEFEVNDSYSTTTNRTFTIKNIQFTNCSRSLGIETLRINLFDELNRSALVSDVDATLTLATPVGAVTAFDFNNNSTFTICMIPNGSTIEDVNIQLNYRATGFSDRFYYSTTDLSNTSQNITLYLLPTTEGQSIQFQVRNQSTNTLVPGLTIYIQRQYSEIGGSYVTVASVQTGATGVGTAFVDTTGAIYKLIVIAGTTTILQYYPTEIVEDPTELLIGYQIFGDWKTASQYITGDCSFTGSDNRTVSCSAVNSQGTDFTTCLRVQDISLWQTTEICNSCSTSAGSSSVTCNASSATTLISYSYWYVNGEFSITIDSGIKDVIATTSSIDQNEGAAVAFLAVLTLFILGLIIHPIVGFLFISIGFAALDLFNIYDMPQELIVPLTIMFAVVGVSMAKKEGII